MKKLLYLLFIIIILNCSKNKPNNKKILFVSIMPEKFFVEQIADTIFDIDIMVKKGKNPAMYEPTPMQMRKLAQAEVFFTINAPYEKTWIPKFHKIYPNLKIINIDKGIKKLPMINPFSQAQDTSKNLDPHVWLSPELVKIQVKHIYNTLIKISPKNKKIFYENYQKFLAKIDSIQNYIHKKVSNIKNKNFIVFHPSWGYFAKEFNLKQIPIEIEGKSPTAEELSKIINFAKQNNIRIILIAPQFSRKELQIVARQINAKIIEADPLAYNWLENLKNIADKISHE